MMAKAHFLLALLTSIISICQVRADVTERLATEFLQSSAEKRIALNVSKGLAAVMIESEVAFGTGVIFSLDGKPKILTASHILQGAKTARVSGFFSAMKALSATVERDLPNDDLAVLSIDLPKSQSVVLQALAQTNLTICTVGVSCTKNSADLGGEEVIISASNEKISITHPQNRFDPSRRTDDVYVSGQYPFIWLIGALTKSGISGGAYYRGGHFSGLVSKVSKGLESLTIAIPSEGIAAVLMRGGSATAASEWIPGLDERPSHLRFRRDGVTFDEAMAGGDIGNGGDPKSPRAGPNGDVRTWNISLEGCIYCGNDVSRAIENPFFEAADKSNPLKINGRPVVALKSSRYQEATVPLYNYLRKNQVPFTFVSPSSPELGRLASARSQHPFDLTYFQVWRKKSKDTLEIARPLEGNFHDGATSLLLDQLTKSDGQKIVISPFPSIYGAVTAKNWLEFHYPEGKLQFSVNRDFSKIEILSAGSERQTVLKAQPVTNPVKIFLTAPSNESVRALLLYEPNDLSELQTIILETREMVYQLSRCDPILVLDCRLK